MQRKVEAGNRKGREVEGEEGVAENEVQACFCGTREKLADGEKEDAAFIQ